MRFDANTVRLGIGTSSPATTLDVNGVLLTRALKVNTGTQFNQIQAGHQFCGSHGGGVKEVLIRFPQGFAQKPLVICTARGEGYYNDTFGITVKYLDNNTFKVNIIRLDAHNAGWGQNLRLDWVAFTVDGLTGI
jgi:hypothetical protein